MAKSKTENSAQIVDLLEDALDSEVSISPELEERFGILIPDQLADPRLNPSQKTTYRQLMIYRLVIKACGGQDKSIQEVLDRLVGKPAQYVENHNTDQTYLEFMRMCLEADRDRDRVRAPKKPKRVRNVKLPAEFDAVQREDTLLEDLGLL